jgi:hypothetical protein
VLIRTQVRVLLLMLLAVSVLVADDSELGERDEHRPAEGFKSQMAHDAQARFDAAAKRAKDEYAQKMAAARQQLARELKKALQEATRRGDFDEGLKIKAALEQVEVDLQKPEEDPEAQPAAAATYLADLAEIIISEHPSSGFTKDGTFPGAGKIEVNGELSPHGLAVHPNANAVTRIAYDLNGKYSVLRGAAGLNQSSIRANGGSETPLEFTILGDGKVLWQARVQKPDDAKEFAVPVRGVRRLELSVRCPGSAHAAHAVWFEPRLEESGRRSTNRRGGQ